MKAMVIREFGGPEVMRFEEVPDPVPEANEVIVQVHSVSINYTLDVIVRSGRYGRPTELPHVLGVDPAGVVTAVGGEVDHVGPGDRVAVSSGMRCGTCEACLAGRDSECRAGRTLGVQCWGGYAELVRAPKGCVHPIPDGLEFKAATVILRHFPTARHMLYERAELQPGEWVLVMGAAGGLGASAVQVAKLMGGRVIAAAGADDRVRTAVDLGADHGVNYRSQDLAEEVRRITDGNGVDVVLENIGDPTLWPGAFDSLARSGRLVTAGAHGGSTVPLDISRLYLRRIKIIGSPGSNLRDIEWTLNAAREGSIRPAPIDRVLPLHEAAEAHLLAERRETSGKLILDPTLSADHPTV